MIRNNYLIGSKNEAFGPGGIQNAITETLVRTEGPIDAKLIDKSINENGTYSASAEGADGFKKVVVDVPNTYFLSDEGKVVSSGALVAQTERETEITENGIYDTTLNNSITVNVASPTPAPTGTKSGAVIRDYDGSIIASYTPAQFAVLSAYPAQPVHTGLVGQGYNWTLANAKAYVAKYGYVEVGATYITDDGKTRYYILIQDEEYAQVNISIGLNGTAVIDWDDGSEPDTITGNDITTEIQTSHDYETVGKYTITINVTNGNASLMNNYNILLSKAEIGSNIISINNTFYSCSALKSITIPSSVTSIGKNAFNDCSSLLSITIPEGITKISQNVFGSCYALTSIVIPDTVTSIDDSAFYECYALTSVIIPDVVTSIDYGIFMRCYALTSVIIPDAVTSFGHYAFNECYTLTSITIPESVTEIGDHVFDGCHALISITFESSTPPTVQFETFANINSSCTIYIPQGSLEAYTTAENYPDPTLYTYVEY